MLSWQSGALDTGKSDNDWDRDDGEIDPCGYSKTKESLVISIVTSRNGKVIRLTDERWVHIIEEHAEPCGYAAGSS
jgi:hypothetical protein